MLETFNGNVLTIHDSIIVLHSLDCSKLNYEKDEYSYDKMFTIYTN